MYIPLNATGLAKAKRVAKKARATGGKKFNGTRELWLETLAGELSPAFEAAGVKLPPFHVSIGFPSTRALSNKGRVIGQCWPLDASTDGVAHVFVSPLLDNDRLVGVLLHELCHAVLMRGPVEDRPKPHGKEFRKLATAIGLNAEQPKVANEPNEFLAETIKLAVQKVGRCPHAPLDASKLGKRKKSDECRFLKLVCACEEPRILRTTRKVVDQGLEESAMRGEDESTAIRCEICDSPFVWLAEVKTT